MGHDIKGMDSELNLKMLLLLFLTFVFVVTPNYLSLYGYHQGDNFRFQGKLLRFYVYLYFKIYIV